MEQLAPCGTLAGLSGHALDDGLAGLGDDALVGLLRASRRLSAWQSGVELAAVAELDHRRLEASGRPGWSRVSEHVAAELAAALVLTGRSADSLLALARDLARLPAVLEALLAGQIDRARAMVFAAELAGLDDRAAAAAAAELLAVAAALTTGQLRHALRTLVRLLDPDAARRRMASARKDTRVEAWQEGSGNLALAGRELDPADAVAADRRITAIARALHAAGAAGSADQLRAAVFTALLAGRDPDTLLPAPGPGQPGTAQPGPGPAGTGTAGGPAGPAAGGGSLAGLAGSVHITLPASTWLGLSDLPGEAAGLGPLDAWTSRDLAARLAAAGPKTRWCITLTRPDRTAAAHACARAGPGPPARPRRPPRLAHQPVLHLARPRPLQPPQPGTRLPAAAPPRRPHQSQEPDLRLPRLPPPRHQLRPRPHHRLGPRRPDLPLQPRPALQKTPPGQTDPRLDTPANRARHPRLDRAPRPQLHRHTKHLHRLAAV